MHSAKQLRIGDLVYSPETHELCRGDKPIKLPKLSYALFELLVQKAPAVVTYEEIAQSVWAGAMVTPETVSQRIKLLRDALGDRVDDPEYLSVIRGVGIKLIPPIVPDSEILYEQPSQQNKSINKKSGRLLPLAVALLIFSAGLVIWQFNKSPEPTFTDFQKIRSLTFVPFAESDENDETGMYAQWVYFEILDSLTSIEDLNVTDFRILRPLLRQSWSENSLFQDLKHQSLLSGEIHFAGGSTTVLMTLKESVTQEAIWTRHYELGDEDLTALPGMIVHDLAEVLGIASDDQLATVINKVDTRSLPALLAYMRANQQENLNDQIRLLDEAIAHDPDFLEVYASRSLAKSWLMLDPDISQRQTREQHEHWKAEIMADADRALSQNGGYFQAHLAKAIIYSLSWDWLKADEQLTLVDNGQDSSIRAAVAMYLFMVATERPQRAIMGLNSAITLYPDWINLRNHLGQVYLLTGDPFSARRNLLMANELSPGNLLSHRGLMLTYLLLGEHDQARIFRDSTAALSSTADNSSALSLLAYVSAQLGDQDLARSFSDQVQEMNQRPDIDVGAASQVLRYLAIGDHEQALQWFGVAVERTEQNQLDLGFFNLYLLKINQLEDPVLDQPEFVEFRSRLGY